MVASRLVPIFYFLPMALLEAFSGLTLIVDVNTAGLAWVAKLQMPTFHLAAGAEYVLQNFCDSTSMILSQPSHLSMIGLKTPVV